MLEKVNTRLNGSVTDPEPGVRRFDTRMGTMYLLVPKVRKGGYVPFFVTERKRSEQALMQVVQEAFINGVSTRKIGTVGQKPWN